MARPPRRNNCWVPVSLIIPNKFTSLKGCAGTKTPITFAILLAPKLYAPKAPIRIRPNLV